MSSFEYCKGLKETELNSFSQVQTYTFVSLGSLAVATYGGPAAIAGLAGFAYSAYQVYDGYNRLEAAREGMDAANCKRHGILAGGQHGVPMQPRHRLAPSN